MTTEPLETQLRRQAEQRAPSFWHRLRSEVVESHLPQGPVELIDIGAGAGFLGEYLASHRPDVGYSFIEPIASLERTLETRFGASANSAGQSTYGGYDVVTLLDVVEHQEDDRAFMADLVSKMDPGARLIMTAPALPSLWSGWDVALGHHRRYGWRSLVDVLRGLPVIPREVSYMFPELVPAGYARVVSRPPTSAGLTDDAAFPVLPPLLDRVLYQLGRASLRLRRWWPAGTSLIAVMDKRA